MLHQLTWAEGEWAAVRARLKGGIFMRPRNGAVNPKQTSGPERILFDQGFDFFLGKECLVYSRGLVSGFGFGV